jgi:acyl carrier protein
MQLTEIQSKIKGIIAGMFDLQPEEVSGTKAFTEMAKYDSMRALEFLSKLENEFNLTIDPDQLVNMSTVDLSAKMIEEQLRAK